MGNCMGPPAAEYIDTGHATPPNPVTPEMKTARNKGIENVTNPQNKTSNTSYNISKGGRDRDYVQNPDGGILEAPNPRIFSFAKLKSATRNFKSDTLLGEGASGKVYKGWLDETTLGPARTGSGMIVAVKKLNPQSMQGLQEWQTEVNFLGRISHPNLVKLLGYCLEDKKQLLVYEYMANGSLGKHLFGSGSQYQQISWDLRLKIAIGAARGLEFLCTSEKHAYWDFKASNILLDSNFDPKLSNFGLVKASPAGGDSHVTNRANGTYEYASPEYTANEILYVKREVYGFGIVLLELLTGLRAFDTTRPNGQRYLIEWAMPLLADKRKIHKLMDPRLSGKYLSKKAWLIARLTLLCLQSDLKSRPSMKEVVDALQAIETTKFRPKKSQEVPENDKPACSRPAPDSGGIIVRGFSFLKSVYQ